MWVCLCSEGMHGKTGLHVTEEDLHVKGKGLDPWGWSLHLKRERSTTRGECILVWYCFHQLPGTVLQKLHPNQVIPFAFHLTLKNRN